MVRNIPLITQITFTVTLSLFFQTIALAQDEPLCFAIFSTGQIVNLSNLCVNDDMHRPSSVETHLRSLQPVFDLAEEGRYSEALSEVNRFISSNPNFAQAYVLRGHIRIQAEDRQGAYEDYQQASRLFESEGNLSRAELIQMMAEDVWRE